MKPCRIDIPGDIHIEALLEHRICILDLEAGAGKTLFLNSLASYCHLKRLSFTRVCFANYLDFDSILKTCRESALVMLDNANLYDFRTIVKSLTSRTKLVLIAGHNLVLNDISCLDTGYYGITKESSMLKVSLRWGCIGFKDIKDTI